MPDQRPSQSKRDPLDVLAEQIAEAVAMAADGNEIGTSAEGYYRWHDELHIAIDNGLEGAERRANVDG